MGPTKPTITVSLSYSIYEFLRWYQGKNDVHVSRSAIVEHALIEYAAKHKYPPAMAVENRADVI